MEHGFLHQQVAAQPQWTAPMERGNAPLCNGMSRCVSFRSRIENGVPATLNEEDNNFLNVKTY